VTEEATEQDQGVGRVGHRVAAWLAWSLWALCLALAAAMLVLVRANDPSRFKDQPFYIAGFVAFVTVGALVAWRRPANRIGWIFCAVALSNFLWAFAWQYAVYALVTEPGSLPGGLVMEWLGSGWTATLGWGLMATFVPLLFPTGRLPSPRWRPVAWATVILLAIEMLVLAFQAEPIADAGPSIPNPLGIEGASAIFALFEGLGMSILLVIMAASVSSLVLRFRHLQGEEREQIKWFAYAAVLLVGSIIVGVLANFVPGLGPLANVLQVLGVAGVPIAVGMAILKYRLYDIDILINRTLVYGALTSTLIAVYFGGVAATQATFGRMTGQEQQPQRAIVISTLVLAALFNPLRRRIQSFIDRRFYRGRYDARKTLAAFSTKMRDETDLDRLGDELVGVVRKTIQPEHASQWLRTDIEAGRSAERQGAP
jgi:hypothetical protein